MKKPSANAALLLSLLYAALLLSVAPARGTQRRAPDEKVKVRAKGRRAVVLTESGRAHALDVSEQIDAARIEDVSVLFLSRAGGFAYLLLDVCGMSKERPDDRQCGAGTECNVVWLKLDMRWRVADAKNVRYESCWSPVTSDEGPKVEGRRMTLAVEDFREEVRREVTYDADDPASGLNVKQYPLPKTTP